ncbi:hypothetical protein [Nitrospira sp. KM1]|nr:hypothetical protein [Nitrospira sp. KM1]
MTDNQVVRVIVGPVKIGDLELRVVELGDGSGRVEIWNGSTWDSAGG